MENVPEKMEKSTPPSVAVDGSKIKNIREAKKLTQLYVANVVGVTTDTISRWENNRYPTIRRDNAEKLASALEVDLEEILRREEPTEEEPQMPLPPEQQPVPGRRIRLLLASVVVLATVLVVLIALVMFRQTGAPPVVERWLPRYGAPGEIIPVQIKVTRKESGARGFIVKEQLPRGWHLVSAAPPAVAGLGDTQEVKWLIPGGSGMVSISYTVRVAPTAELKSQAEFAGTIVVHTGVTRSEPIGGDRLMTVAGVHWADQNGDGRIDDNEIMPAYYLTEEMKGLGLDWKEIEAIWSGKGYRWDQERREFVVIK
jgi:transcriptional regulator with XRE-family HTH domain